MLGLFIISVVYQFLLHFTIHSIQVICQKINNKRTENLSGERDVRLTWGGGGLAHVARKGLP